MIDDVAHIAAMRRLQDVMANIPVPPKGWTEVHSVSLELAVSNGDTAMVLRLTDELEATAQLPQKHLVETLTNLRRLARQLFKKLDYISIAKRLLHHFGMAQNLPRRQK